MSAMHSEVARDARYPPDGPLKGQAGVSSQPAAVSTPCALVRSLPEAGSDSLEAAVRPRGEHLTRSPLTQFGTQPCCLLPRDLVQVCHLFQVQSVLWSLNDTRWVPTEYVTLSVLGPEGTAEDPGSPALWGSQVLTALGHRYFSGKRVGWGSEKQRVLLVLLGVQYYSSRHRLQQGLSYQAWTSWTSHSRKTIQSGKY